MSNEKNHVQIIAKNISSLRKENNMTQAQLAEQINYSDKSISKWERGEGVPDVSVLLALCDLFHVTLNDICYEVEPTALVQTSPKNHQKSLISLMGISLVWVVATVFFILFQFGNVVSFPTWLVFVYAVPISSIVALVFSAMWLTQACEFISLSILLWSLPFSINLTVQYQNSNTLYILAAVLQVLGCLWYWYRKEKRKTTTPTEKA